MAKIAANPNVLQWQGLARKWAGQGVVPIPAALILAIIQLESAGRPQAKRAESEALERIINERKDSKIREIVKATRLQPIQIMTSYGLMQLLITTAWGYLSKHHKGPGVIDALLDPDQNIRYGTAHLATLYKKRNGDIRLTARDYNGAGAMAEAYGRNAQLLAIEYDKILRGGV